MDYKYFMYIYDICIWDPVWREYPQAYCESRTIECDNMIQQVDKDENIVTMQGIENVFKNMIMR